METINRDKFITLLSEKLDTTKVFSKEILEGMIEVVEEAVANGDKIAISNFGTLEVRESKARVGHSPQNPEIKIDIPAKKRVKFKSGKRLAEITNGEIEI